MIPPVCMTCGFFIGSVVIEYETEKEKICANTMLSEEEQAEKIQQLIKSFKDQGLTRYCCKMRLMATKDLVYEVIPSED